MTDSMPREHRPGGPLSVPPDRSSTEEQPRWRRDFPIDWAEDDYVSRRDLVKYVVLTSGAFAVGQLWLVYKKLFDGRREPTPAQAVATVSELPDGRTRLDFVNPRPDEIAVLITARRR